MNFLVDQRGFLVLKLNIRGTLLGAWRQGGGTARLLLLAGRLGREIFLFTATIRILMASFLGH